MADKMKNNGGSMEAGTVLDREGGHEKKESVLERMVSGPPAPSCVQGGGW